MAVDILKSKSSVGRAGDRGGVCRFCGCTEYDGCCGPVPEDELVPIGCHWIDVGHRICSMCAPASKAEGASLRALRRAGYGITPAWLRAHHLGFVIGWFNVTSRSRYGRNPFKRIRVFVEAWELGQRAGAEASRIYVTKFSEITNEPRRAALLASMPRGRRAGA